MRRFTRGLIVAAGALALALPARSGTPKPPEPPKPSFSCAGKLSRVERMICGSHDAAQEDFLANAAYTDLRPLLAPQDWPAVVAEQRAWLAERDRCGDVACVIAAMKRRRDSLYARQSVARAEILAPLQDKPWRDAVFAAGAAALRQKYDDFDHWIETLQGLWIERPRPEFCGPVTYREISCSSGLGRGWGICNDEGERDDGRAEFHVIVAADKSFTISHVEAYQQCAEPMPLRRGKGKTKKKTPP